MAEGRAWSTATWTDPDGGTVLLHGTFPTVVHPRVLWPDEAAWDGVAVLEDAEAPHAWAQEAADERASPGVNLEAVRFGGHEARLLEAFSAIEGVQWGPFQTQSPFALCGRLSGLGNRCSSSNLHLRTSRGRTSCRLKPRNERTGADCFVGCAVVGRGRERWSQRARLRRVTASTRRSRR